MFTTKNLFKLVGKHILIAISFVMLASTIVVIISNQIADASTKAAKSRHLAALLGVRTVLISNLKHEVEIIGTNDTTIKSAFIPADNILDFVSILESIALKNGITQSFSFSSPIPATISAPFPITTINYQDTISSNVQTFAHYLNDFENLPYFTKIDSLTISSGTADWRTASTISFNASVIAHSAQ